jgi:hypothetical protein
MIKYSATTVRLEAFGNNFEQLFTGSDNLVYVSITQTSLNVFYTYQTQFFVDQVPVLRDSGQVNSDFGFSVFSNVPKVITIDCGLPITGTWYAANQTNTFNILLVILGHEV